MCGYIIYVLAASQALAYFFQNNFIKLVTMSQETDIEWPLTSL